nr:hypothetical protein [Pandoravirus aubagnensis]
MGRPVQVYDPAKRKRPWCICAPHSRQAIQRAHGKPSTIGTAWSCDLWFDLDGYQNIAGRPVVAHRRRVGYGPVAVSPTQRPLAVLAQAECIATLTCATCAALCGPIEMHIKNHAHQGLQPCTCP